MWVCVCLRELKKYFTFPTLILKFYFLYIQRRNICLNVTLHQVACDKIFFIVSRLNHTFSSIMKSSTYALPIVFDFHFLYSIMYSSFYRGIHTRMGRHFTVSELEISLTGQQSLHGFVFTNEDFFFFFLL